MTDPTEPNISEPVRRAAEEIIALTDQACARMLDAEYAALARKAVAELARLKPSPLRPRRNGAGSAGWAAGIVYALRMVNQVAYLPVGPYVGLDEICEAFGVPVATAMNRATRLRKLLNLSQNPSAYQRADVIEAIPATWLVELGGTITDSRDLPLDAQAQLCLSGDIPFMPSLGRHGTATYLARPNPGAEAGRTRGTGAGDRGRTSVG